VAVCVAAFGLGLAAGMPVNSSLPPGAAAGALSTTPVSAPVSARPAPTHTAVSPALPAIQPPPATSAAPSEAPTGGALPGFYFTPSWPGDGQGWGGQPAGQAGDQGNGAP